MGGATIVEKYRGTEFVTDSIYGSWWFTVVWALLAAVAVAYFLRMRVRRPSLVALHLSFVIILAGALLTHLTSRRGMVHLRKGEVTDKYVTTDNKGGMAERTLPFKLRLDDFKIIYHDGTTSEQDYQSQLTVIDGNAERKAVVSMNKIYSGSSVRLYQSSYDSDLRGSVLSMNADPYGIPVTYTGYGLLFLSLVWMLFDPRGAYRRVLKSDLFRRGALALALVFAFSGGISAARVLPKDTAERFGRLNILYNGRICPMQTFAIDFTKKLCGSRSYNGYTAEQVLTGFIFYGDDWGKEPILKIKGGELRGALQLPKYCSVSTFFNQMMGGYILGPYVQEYYSGQQDAFHKQAADVDDRLMMVMDLRRGTPLKVFPVTLGGQTTWYSPTEKITDKRIGNEQRAYIHNIFSLINQEVGAGNMGTVDEIVGKMQKYQVRYGGTSLPSATQIKAERLYNAVPWATILFIVNLTLGFCLSLTLARREGSEASPKDRKGRHNALFHLNWRSFGVVFLVLSFLTLTLCLALRWVISGTVPMANGYETMLFMAWLIMLLSLVLCRRVKIIMPFGFLMSGFFLLVSHISQMDPQITHVMPVLNSPLLSVHVSVIMMSFALLSLTFICAITALLILLFGRKRGVDVAERLERLRLLSDLFLYPALAMLGIGVFVGAIWANVSWGTYWSWDAKEVWGLITFMVYGVAVHRQSLPFLRRPVGYHVFMAVAFLTIIMTYFGVNYFLGGMHSYA